MSKKSIGLFITSKQYVRNFIDTGIVNNLSKDFYVHIFFLESLKILIKKNKLTNCQSITKYKESKNNNYHKFHNIVKLWKHRNKAKSFRARVLENYRIDSKRFTNPNNNNTFINFFIIIKKIPNFFIDLLKFFFVNIFSNKIFYSLFKFFYSDRIKVNHSLLNCFKKKNIELIMIPSSGHTADDIDLMKIGKLKKIPTYFVIDNWDNLTSKIYYDIKPNYLSCWGDQSKMYAKKIHNLKNISNIGSARYDFYFKERKKVQKKIFKFPYVLFLGSGLKWNENEVLFILDQYISKNKGKFKDLKIVYRPHPKMDWRKDFNIDNFDNVVLDLQIAKTKSREWPKLNYYPRLLKNSLFIVGGITSMIIESAIFYKKYIVPVHEDKKYLWNPKYVYSTRPHLKGINKLDNVNLCKDISNLSKIFDKCFLDKKKMINFKKIDSQRNYFLYHDNKSFSERIKFKIKEIFKNETNYTKV